jgi:hypothetical protein
MSKIFKNQTYLRIKLTTGVDITGALDLRIYYRKPVSKEIGYVTAASLDNAEGILFYDILPGDSGGSDFLDEVGKWKFWAYVEFSDSRVARGETVLQEIYEGDQ